MGSPLCFALDGSTCAAASAPRCLQGTCCAETRGSGEILEQGPERPCFLCMHGRVIATRHPGQGFIHHHTSFSLQKRSCC